MERNFRPLVRCAVLLFVMLLAAGLAHAEQGGMYTREAKLRATDSDKYPGVYYVQAMPDDSNATIGIPSISKKTLTDAPTQESPAIIMGAAVPFEERTGFITFTPKPGAGNIYPPYSNYRYSFINEPDLNGGTGVHRKITGFDGSYVFVRVDVSKLLENVPKNDGNTYYLHVKQTGNKAIMGYLLSDADWDKNKYAAITDACSNKAGVYSLDNGGASLKDKDGSDQDTPYIDVILFSSGSHVAGADTGSTAPDVMNADFPLKMYIDQTRYYNDQNFPDASYDPAQHGNVTLEQMMLNKYFKDDVQEQDVVCAASYTMKGSDLELEVMAERLGNPREYWSLRKALAYQNYNEVPIKLICEVPVLQGLLVESTGGQSRHVIFDVNSFDIQIANHQTTGAAALTVKNAKLTLMDTLSTTGSELAVGNNATMSIQGGGTLIIDESCQLEVEYDAASTAQGETPPDLSVGVLSIENGGKIINNGVITVEGTEGKPIDPAAPAQRDVKDAEFHIKPGGTLENNGCLLSYGALYNNGAIVNNGKYGDVIASSDPDKGNFTYHKGIQVSWKDDVTQDNITMGHLYNGGDDTGAKNPDALIENNGDIVLVPGTLENYGSLRNGAGANLYLCGVKDAIIPIQATVYQPYVTEKRVAFKKPVKSWVYNWAGSSLVNEGNICAAEVKIVSNGRTGDLTSVTGGEMFKDIALYNLGQAANRGTIDVDGVFNFGDMTNEGSGVIQNRVQLSATADRGGALTDTAATKLTNVYNGALTVNGTANHWTHAACSEFTVTPTKQDCEGGQTVTWTVRADAEQAGEGVQYMINLYESMAADEPPVATYTIPANTDVGLTSPTLPAVNQNVIFNIYIADGLRTVVKDATVTVTTATIFTPPTPISQLVYNGADQVLTTTGYATGKMVYRLGEDGAWTDAPPAAKNAGTYKVYYKQEAAAAEGANFVVAEIAKRPLTVAANDVVSTVNAQQAMLGWTASGLVEGEALIDGDVTVSTEANLDVAGTYTITVSVTENYPNYAIKAVPGVYTVTTSDFNVVAKDKYGVFSDDVTYKGFNIDLTVPERATAYYSTATPLNSANYQTDGLTALNKLPAGAGEHIVYYYVTDGENEVSGSKRVIIEKAKQAAPDKLITREESFENAGDGVIEGLEPRAMEYRRIDNDGTYTDIYDKAIYVVPGTYLVRRKADENHYASPDTAVTVGRGGAIQVYLDRNDATGAVDVLMLAGGDLVTRPAENPAFDGARFTDWFLEGAPYDFSEPVVRSFTITAGWTLDQPISVVLPKDTKVIKPSAFEGVELIASVEIPYGCTSIGANAFKGCTMLRRIAIPATVTSIDPTAFDGCGSVCVFGVNGSSADYQSVSAAQQYCDAHDNLTFIADVRGF